MTEGSNSDILQEFELEYNRIASSTASTKSSSPKNSQSVTKFIQEYVDLCLLQSIDLQPDTRFVILSNLRVLCVEILKSFPPGIDEDGQLQKFFQEEAGYQSEDTSIDFIGIIQSLQDLKDTKDVTEIEDAQCFYYYTILEYFILVSNNLTYTCLEQENFDVALDLTIKTVESWRLLQYSSYHLKYQVSTVLINLASLVEEDNKLQASQLLCNVAVHLENLELAIDADVERDQIYSYVSDRSSQFMFLLRPKDDSQSFAKTKFNDKKSFLLARLCMLYAYYADFLIAVGRSQEGDQARKHASIIKRKLEKKERDALEGSREADSVITSSDNGKMYQSKSSSKTGSRPATAFNGTMSSNFSNNSKLPKENIIFQKNLDINDNKYRVMVLNHSDLDCVELLAYSKARKHLKRVYIHFQEIIQYARDNDLEISNDQGMTNLFNKVSKLIYFKEGKLNVHHLKFTTNPSDLKLSKFL